MIKKQKKKLTIIIVTFESSYIIKSCLKRINFNSYDVFVVDNNSKDNTPQIVQKEFPKVNLIKLDQNFGYSRANNIALRKAKTDYALTLNPDAFILENDIEKILKAMDKNSKIAIASAMMYHYKLKDDQIIDSQFIDLCLSTLQKEEQNIYYTSFISGAGMFLNMKIFRKIGFFDENFFLYCEDNELCKRSLKNGYKNAIIKNTKLYHQSGASLDKKNRDIISNKIIWHKFGWSKAYYTAAIHGIIVGKLRAIRVFLKYLLLIIKDLIIKFKINPINKYAFLGNFSYLIGLKAFDKNNKPRG